MRKNIRFTTVFVLIFCVYIYWIFVFFIWILGFFTPDFSDNNQPQPSKQHKRNCSDNRITFEERGFGHGFGYNLKYK